MPQKLVRTRLPLEPGYIYLIDADGDLARVQPRAQGEPRPEKQLRLALDREPGFLYFVDGDGDVSRAPLVSANPPGSPRSSGSAGAQRSAKRGAKRMRSAGAHRRGV